MRQNNVYIIDDDVDVCDSLMLYLRVAGFHPRMFSSGSDFLRECGDIPPGCVLLDVRMPDIDGFGVLSNIGKASERLAIIVMTGHGDIATAVKAMRAGAVDFVEKPFEEELIMRALTRAQDSLRDKIKHSERKALASSRLESLTPREREVLKGIVDGHPNKVIAHHLGISVRTVEVHRANLMDRLDVKSSAQVVRLAFDAGLIDRRASHSAAPAIA